MNSETTFKRIAGISAIVAAPVTVISLVLAFLAVEFNADFKPEDVITLGDQGATNFRTAWMISDALGYALLLTPAVIYLWYWLRSNNRPWVTLITVFGLAYVFTEVIFLAIIGGAVPPMMLAYTDAAGSERDMLKLVFDTLIDMVFYGIGAFTYLYLGLWFAGIGSVLRKAHRALGIIMVILGILWLVQGIMLMLGIKDDTLGVVELLFWPVWTLWLGILILRDGGDSKQMPSASHAS